MESFSRLRVVYMGSSAFAVPPLKTLLAHKDQFDLVGLLTQPPRKQGRGQKITPTPTHQFLNHYMETNPEIPVMTPQNFNDENITDKLVALEADFFVVVAYGLILPAAVLNLPKFCAVNIHASLLPRWRGAAPIQRAIEAGDQQTGVTLIKMDAGLDTGDCLSKVETPILQNEDGEHLFQRLAELGAQMLPDCLAGIANKTITPVPQETEGASYAKKIHKQEGLIGFEEDAENYLRRMRSFAPALDLYFKLGDQLIKVKQMECVPCHETVSPATIISVNPLVVACANQALKLISVQPPSRSPMAGHALAERFHLKTGDSI